MMRSLRPVRDSLRQVPAYTPGKRPDGEEVEPARLASNESPFGPLPAVAAAVAAMTPDVNRYPDNRATALREAVAEIEGVTPDRLLIGNGSSALIRDAVSVLAGPGDEVVFADPTFPLYRNVTLAVGAEPVAVPLLDHRHDLDAMAAAVTGRTRVIFVCNPNNPTGTTVPADRLAAFLGQVPPDVAVIVDEAYADFDETATSSLPMLETHGNLAVLRTFSKAYGLAGLRIGYMAGPSEVLGWMSRASSPFSVSNLAQAAALQSLRPAAQEELGQRVRRLREERARVEGELALQGMPFVPSRANFVYLPLGGDSRAFAGSLEEANVLVRVIGGGVRVTIGTGRENDMFLAAAAQWGTSSKTQVHALSDDRGGLRA